MSDLAQTLVEHLIEQIFQNRREQEQRTLNEQLTALARDRASKGTLRSSSFYGRVGLLHGQFLMRLIDQTLDQAEQTFRQANRRDGTFFWNVVDSKLHQIVDSIRTSMNTNAVSFAAGKSRGDENAGPLAARAFNEYGDQAKSYIQSRINELRLRAQFIVMKSAADRKASDIPDVAVMMWFPSEGQDAIERANSKFQAISDAVKSASKGLATVDKIDNPTLVHKDRISPVVETWVAKSVAVVCDLEGNRPNVFYEFGFARAIGTDVLSVRPDGEKTDFHLAQWNIDSYGDFEDLRTKLIPRLEKILSNYDLSGTV